jgi:hypothetical protein
MDFSYLFLIVSGSIIVSSAISISSNSSLSGQASSLHQLAQTDRVWVVEQLLEDFEPTNEFNILMGSLLSPKLSAQGAPQSLIKDIDGLITATQNTLNNADKVMSSANSLDKQADQLEHEADSGQLTDQIGLAIGSALFGAVLGWAFTQLFAEARWRKVRRTSSSQNEGADRAVSSGQGQRMP